MPDEDMRVVEFSERPALGAAVSQASRVLAKAGFKLAFLAAVSVKPGKSQPDGSHAVEVACAWAQDLIRSAPEHADDAEKLVLAVSEGVNSLLDGRLMGGSPN